MKEEILGERERERAGPSSRHKRTTGSFVRSLVADQRLHKKKKKTPNTQKDELGTDDDDDDDDEEEEEAETGDEEEQEVGEEEENGDECRRRPPIVVVIAVVSFGSTRSRNELTFGLFGSFFFWKRLGSLSLSFRLRFAVAAQENPLTKKTLSDETVKLDCC